MIRYNVAPGALDISADGEFVKYEDARRDIERLGQELFAERVARRSADAAALSMIKERDITNEKLRKRARMAVMALGYPDPDDERD